MLRDMWQKKNSSDHHPTLVEYNLVDNTSKETMFCKRKKFVNWNDLEFVENYRNRLSRECTILNARLHAIKKLINKSQIKHELNAINQDFQRSIINARDKAYNELYLTGRSKKPKFNGKTKKWWTDELRCAFNRVFRIKNEVKNSDSSEKIATLNEELKCAKREFRVIKRFNIKLLYDCNLRKLDEMFRNNKNNFWKKLKNLDNKKQDIEADLVQIREEFKKIFTIRNNVDKKHEDKMNKILDKFIKESFDTIHDLEIDEKLISCYILDLTNGKSIGISGISNEMLKNGHSKDMTLTIKLIFETIINVGVIPICFNTSILKPLIKDSKKSTKDSTNLRPLAISDALSNMFEKLLLHYIDLVYTNHFKQFGFKKQSSCSHALFILKVALSFAKQKNKRLYAVAIDASKAFDKVNRTYLWVKLIEMEVHSAIVRSIILYYNESEIIINLNEENSAPFKSTIGVRQGGILSPRLFSIYIHDLITEISKMKVGIKVGRLSIDIIGYADDILLVSNIKSNVQKMLDKVEQYCNMYEIKVNGDKTVLLIFNKWCTRSKKELNEDGTNLTLTLQNIKLVESFSLKYLGMEITTDLTNKKHIDTRCDKALKAMSMIKAKGLGDAQIHAHTKSEMYKTFVMPILTYGLDLLTINKKEHNQLRITESNIVKNLLNVRSSCRSKPIMAALKIEQIDRRLIKMKLSLMKRLKENHYTNVVLMECKKNNVQLDIVNETEKETFEFSDALSFENKCSMKIEILSHASREEWKHNSKAHEISNIFELKDKSKIRGLIMLLTSTYVLNFTITA
jgi:hypothetical protein